MSSLTNVHIWLTTLGAVDSYFHPRRQVAYHPDDPNTPVWLFVYEGDQVPILHADGYGKLVEAPREGKLMHVTSAIDPTTAAGAFIYVYGWTELGSPSMPFVLPTPSLNDQAPAP